MKLEKTPYIKYKNLYVIPTFHSRIEFARLVREAFYTISPDVIAVELPGNIRDEVLEGVQRLPFLSLIAYSDSLTPQKLNIVPIDPGDSIIEAIRLGLDSSIPIELIDFSVSEYIPQPMQLPDDYSLTQIGLPLFYQKIKENFEQELVKDKEFKRDSVSIEKYFKEREQSEENTDNIEKDILREKFMAGYLNRMMPLYHRILLVVGMAHWEQIQYYLEHPEANQEIDIDLLPYKFVQLYNVRSADARFLLKELPYHTYKWNKFRA